MPLHVIAHHQRKRVGDKVVDVICAYVKDMHAIGAGDHFGEVDAERAETLIGSHHMANLFEAVMGRSAYTLLDHEMDEAAMDAQLKQYSEGLEWKGKAGSG